MLQHCTFLQLSLFDLNGWIGSWLGQRTSSRYPFIWTPDAANGTLWNQHVFIRTKTKLKLLSLYEPCQTLLSSFTCPPFSCLSSSVGPSLSLSLCLSHLLPRGRSKPRLEALLPLCVLCYFCLGPLCAANQPWGQAQPQVCVCECVSLCPLPSLRSHTGRPAWEVSAALYVSLHLSTPLLSFPPSCCPSLPSSPSHLTTPGLQAPQAMIFKQNFVNMKHCSEATPSWQPKVS